MKKVGSLLAAVFIAIFVLFSCQNATSKKNSTENNPILFSNPDRAASCVFLTQDEQNNPVMSWVEMDSTKKKLFYFSKFNIHKKGFGDPVMIPIEENAAIHEEGMPKIAFKGDGSIFAMYETSEPLKGSKWGLGDVRYVQSFDQGKTWTKPRSVSAEDYAHKRSSSYADLTRLADGEIGIVWLGTHPSVNRRPLKFVKTNGRENLTQVITLDTQACECCRTAISSAKNGKVSIAYRNLSPSSIRDISVSLSFNNGESFKQPVSFSHDNWKVDGCPHAGPSVSSSLQNTYITWFTDSDKDAGVNYATLDDSGNMIFEKNLSPDSRYIQVNHLSNGSPVMAYSKDFKEGDSYYSKIVVGRIADHKLFEKEISSAKVQADFPVIEGVGNSNALVAWKNNDKIFYKFVKVSAIKSEVVDVPDFAVVADKK